MITINGVVCRNLEEQVAYVTRKTKECVDVVGSIAPNVTQLTADVTANKDDINTLKAETSDLRTLTRNISVDGDDTTITGGLNIKGKSTFESDIEAKGKLIVNSADDITDKDGNAIVKNESLEEFKRLYYNEAADGKFAGMYIAPYENEYVLEDLSKFTSLKSLFNNCTFVVASGTSGRFIIGDIGKCSTAHMFYHCKSIGDDFSTPADFIIVLGNGTSTNGYWMFEGCSTLKSIEVEDGKKFSTANDCSLFVSYCTSLESIGPLDFSGVTSFFYAFLKTPKLKHIHCTHFKVSFNISSSTAFEQSDLVEIISNLDPVSTPQTLTMGATNLAKLTQDQILVATGKGWTLA